MTITAKQADQAKGIVRETLDAHNRQSVRFTDVLTKPDEDFDGVPFLDVFLVYDGEPSDLDIGVLNSYDSHLLTALRDAGIHAIPCVEYISQSDIDQLGAPWTG